MVQTPVAPMPTGRLQIDWSHPLAQKLVFCCVLNSNNMVIDLVTGKTAIAGSASKDSLGLYGPSLKFANTAASAAAFGTYAPIPNTVDCTVMALANPAASGGVIPALFSQFDTSGLSAEIGLYANCDTFLSNASGNATFIYSTAGGSSFGATATFAVDGNYHLFAGRTRAAATTVWVDGTSTAGTSGVTAAWISGMSLGVGDRPTDVIGTYAANCNVVIVSAWSYGLENKHMIDLSIDPFCFLRPADDSTVGIGAQLLALLARAATMAKSFASPSGKAPLAGISATQAKASTGGIYKMAFAGRSSATVALRNIPGILLQAIASAKATLRSTVAGSAALSGTSATQAKASLTGIYKMAFSAKAATASTLHDTLNAAVVLAAAGTAATQTKLKSAMSLAAAMSAKATAQTKASLTGKFAMPFAASAKAAAFVKGLASLGVPLAASGASAAQTKLKSAMSLSALLSAKATAQTQASASGIYKMAFSAKAATQAKASSAFARLVFLTANAVAQTKAKTGNTLSVVLSAKAASMSFVRGVYSRAGVVNSRFRAYWIS